MATKSMLSADIDLQQDVLDELDWDPEVEVTDVGVEVDQGVVTLTGTVDSYAKKSAAERAALRVAGVRAVANNIQIKRPGTWTRTDTEIAKALADSLEWNASVPFEAIDIKVEDGRVTLRGEVSWNFERQAAEHAARRVLGVKSVSNQIRIKPRQVAPDVVRTSIERALLRSAQVDADHIRVHIDGGHVTLSGIVHATLEKREAESAAWRAPGVTAVTNRIQVQVPL